MYRTSFAYCDFWSGKGLWRRIKINEVEDRAKKAKFFNIYTTIQCFESPQNIPGEMQWGPLFFDLDSPTDINIALEDARELVQFFLQMGINQEFIHCFFSGRKGFHIIIDQEVLGIEPHENLAAIMKHAAYYLKDFLNLSTIDLQAYSSRRLLRLTNSLHPNSGKYKIELYHSELMNKSREEILKLAVAPREPLYDPIEYSGIQPDAIASQWWKEITDRYNNQETLHKLKPRHEVTITDKYPDCVAFLLSQTSLPQSHTGNRAVLALGAYFKDAGKTTEETVEIVSNWLSKIDNCGDAGDIDKLKPMVEATIRCIYEKPNSENYHFACSFIRALGGSETKVPCAYEKCLLIKDPTDQEPETPISVHLSEASKAEYIGHKLIIPAMIAGKDGAPYGVPKEFAVVCTTDKRDETCGNCLLRDSGEYSCELTAKDEILLSFIDTTEDRIIQIMKRRLKAGKCPHCYIERKSETNMETLRLVPVVDDNRYGAKQHVMRVSYYLGHGIELNRKYKIIAYTYTDPRDQHMTHLISEAQPDTTSLDLFKVTPELKKELSVFQPKEKQAIWDKFNEIHDDLEANVYKIWHRRFIAYAIDLVYHSVLQFSFQGQLLQRGWCETLILGDSGQGKTQLIERLHQHYRLGEGASGESARRTGLVYNFQTAQNNNWMLQWGRIPLNDRGLLYIDELSGLPVEDISLMSHLRSTGRVIVHAIISAETNARTRLIFLSNSREGRALNTYNYGVEAIASIIPQSEDVRRLDFAVTAASGEVPLNSLNRADMPKEEHIYTTYLCEQLILWSWSRKIDDIIFTKEAESQILQRATEMSNKYFAKIPLVEPADQRIKLARLSAAVACRMFSCNETGEKVIIHLEHVDFIYEFLQKCYDSPSMGYDAFSLEERAKSTLTQEQKIELKGRFSTFKEPKRLRDVLLRTRSITARFFEDNLDYSREESREVMRFLMINNLVEDKGKYGTRKTPQMVAFLKELSIPADVLDYSAQKELSTPTNVLDYSTQNAQE